VPLGQPKTNKLREARRNELADFAIESLAANGYARASLRDIARLSGMSLGRMHYYFESKADLIQYCVARYKQRFVENLTNTTAGAANGTELLAGFMRGLEDGVRIEGRLHRLWYDLRAQALFDEGLRDPVTDIERSLRALVDQMYAKLKSFGDLPPQPMFDSEAVYLMLDALFFRALQHYLSGADRECLRFQASLRDFFAKLSGE
jgi:AcrR family transcriptional regulator